MVSALLHVNANVYYNLSCAMIKLLYIIVQSSLNLKEEAFINFGITFIFNLAISEMLSFL